MGGLNSKVINYRLYIIAKRKKELMRKYRRKNIFIESDYGTEIANDWVIKYNYEQIEFIIRDIII